MTKVRSCKKKELGVPEIYWEVKSVRVKGKEKGLGLINL